MWISPGRNESSGLVQHDGEWRRDVNKFPIHLDVVAPAGLRAEVGTGFTVDRDPARRDQFIAIPTRSETRSGKKTIKAHRTFLHQVSFRANSRMERLGKARHGRDGRRLSERDVSESNPAARFTGKSTGSFDPSRYAGSAQDDLNAKCRALSSAARPPSDRPSTGRVF